MLRPRIIPILLLHKNGLYKSVNFDSYKYIGDPLNAVKIFNEKKVDELAIIDIDASINNRIPNFKLISKIASACRMPLAYGGGVKTINQFNKIIGLGVEKVIFSSGFIENSLLIRECSEQTGSQSIVICLDVRKEGIFTNKYNVYTYNGKKKVDKTLLELIIKSQDMGAGEIILNSIDLDGSLKGYDINLIHKVYGQLKIPITILGGAGNLQHIKKLFENYPIVGAGVGSLFVLKGKYRAVLIQYPSALEKQDLYPYKVNKNS